MQVRFLLGPAGSGKTHRCLSEIQAALAEEPEGVPLVLLAPKHMTYELERKLLAANQPGAYTRLNILSFERLARFVFRQVDRSPPELLDEDGRVMVLRALLVRCRNELKLFRASARLNGFARQLSTTLSELQSAELTPELLREIARRSGRSPSLAGKLEDLAVLMQHYSNWLDERGLRDREWLLEAAAQALGPSKHGQQPVQTHSLSFPLRLWVDGFSEFSDNELRLLTALIPHCAGVAISFCVPEPHNPLKSDRSAWALPLRNLQRCQRKLSQVPGLIISTEYLGTDKLRPRFHGSPILQLLENHWDQPPAPGTIVETSALRPNLRQLLCSDPEAEALFAAAEIQQFVREGGRYRETAVLVRNIQDYHRVIRRVFSRAGIPFFVDQRRSVAHHPAAELTRSALRTVILGWQHEDWFSALKTGLVPASSKEIDRLENEALARGWKGNLWQQPIKIRAVARDQNEQERFTRLESELETLRCRIISPFQTLALALHQPQHRPNGAEMATAVRRFWEQMLVKNRLETWSNSVTATENPPFSSAVPHDTVWQEINAWLDNIELAFASDALPIRDWLPVLESGLSNLSIGVIPAALDQVLFGAIDRSRNPDIKIALVLGLNEGVFPVFQTSSLLLTDLDRHELANEDFSIGMDSRQQLQRESHLAYIACTRARKQVILTCSTRSIEGKPLHPSPILAKVRQIVPGLELEQDPTPQAIVCPPRPKQNHRSGQSLLPIDPGEDKFSPELAERLYGPVIKTSVSRIEQFAACPFKFFIHSGLRAEERQFFELDSREQGSFQHEVLALFHEQLRAANLRWRDITPEDARRRIEVAAAALTENYREGLLQTDQRTRFFARAMVRSLQDFIEVLVTWISQQYQFDPTMVELAFGKDELQPPWSVELGNRHQLALQGRIDRIDLLKQGAQALCVVVDYKSSRKQLEPVLIEHGLQLQLLAYLKVLQHWPNPKSLFGAERLIPVGVFYVNLRGKNGNQPTRSEALTSTAEKRKLAFQHTGRFDMEALQFLDSRPDEAKGDQFSYRRNKDGSLNRKSREPMETAKFQELLASVETSLIGMGKQIYSGAVAVNPYRRGSERACDRCSYQAICRIDPWTHVFRVLKATGTK